MADKTYASGIKGYTPRLREYQSLDDREAAYLNGCWILVNGNMYFSNGEQWSPAQPLGTEALLAPGYDIPEGWFDTELQLDGNMSNHKLIANLFNISYYLDDLVTRLTPIKANLFQNAAGTIPVLDEGDPVGFAFDTSGNGNHWTQASVPNRGEFRTVNGLPSVSLAGVNAFLSAPVGVNNVCFMIEFTSQGCATMLVRGAANSSGNISIGYRKAAATQEILVFDEVLDSTAVDTIIDYFVLEESKQPREAYGLVTSFEYTWHRRSDIVQMGFVDTSAATRLNYTWDQCTNMQVFPAIDTSNVTEFWYSWQSCQNLLEFPLIDTSKGRTLYGTWNNCRSLTEFPVIDLGSADQLSSTWSSCRGLTDFPLIDFSNVRFFSSAWSGCTGLTTFPQIDLTNCLSLSFTWSSCTGFTTFPLLDLKNTTSCQGAWYSCNRLTSFPLIDFSKVTNIGYAWGYCTSLQLFPAINTSSCTNFDYTWVFCSSLTSFPALDTSKGTRFDQTWRYCRNLTAFPYMDFSKGQTFYETWANCEKIVSFDSTPFDSAVASTSTNAEFIRTWNSCNRLANFPANMFDNSRARRYNDAFRNCALTQQSVDNILVSVATAAQSFNIENGNIGIYGGTSAAPGAAGLAAKATLQSLGWTVLTN